MTSLTNHTPSAFVKLIYIGDSGTGKTGSLVSLVQAGYKLYVLDMDANITPLKKIMEKDCPDKLDMVDSETLRDKYKATSQGPVCQAPKAFVASLKLLEKWSDESDPSQWGKERIFVLDSLSSFGRAAYEWAKGMNPAAKDPRQWYFLAQQAIENVISLLTGAAFETNLIVISHVSLIEVQEEIFKGYPNAIGKAMGPLIPRYFSTMILAESDGSGKNVKRTIRTSPTGVIDLKNPTPWKFESKLPLETGLATIFEKLKET